MPPLLLMSLSLATTPDPPEILLEQVGEGVEIDLIFRYFDPSGPDSWTLTRDAEPPVVLLDEHDFTEEEATEIWEEHCDDSGDPEADSGQDTSLPCTTVYRFELAEDCVPPGTDVQGAGSFTTWGDNQSTIDFIFVTPELNALATSPGASTVHCFDELPEVKARPDAHTRDGARVAGRVSDHRPVFADFNLG